MNSNATNLDTTISYYEKNADKLIESYETADMSDLYRFLLSYLIPNAKVLDIGFGSGRDIEFLRRHGFDVWGVDPAESFVKHAKQRFSDIQNHFFKASLPELNIPATLHHSFDNIILIAVWMHLPETLHESAVASVCKFLKPKGKVILSYSITPRDQEEERYFETIERTRLQDLFEKHGCSKEDSIINKDGLGNREIVWVTEAYRNDKF